MSSDNKIETVFISIGSNLGDRVANCEKAINLLAKEPGVNLVRRSSFYETQPWGVEDQPVFINCAVEIQTRLTAPGLLDVIKEIEKSLGKTLTRKWGPRVIDLDIIFFGHAVIKEEGLEIPHPFAHEREFVLVPLVELAPEFIHPVFKVPVSELLSRLPEKGRGRVIE